MVETVSIGSEQELWAALERALSTDADDAPFMVDFSNAEWAKVQLVYRGPRFKGSLTPTAMKGIIDLQASLYRSAAAILRDDPDVRRLTDVERESLELTFTIHDGSAETEGEGKDFLTKIAEAVANMTSRHKLIALLLLGGAYFGGDFAKSYFSAQNEHEEKLLQARLEHEEKIQTGRAQEELLRHQERTQELLARSIQQSADAARVHAQSAAGLDAVVRNSGNAASITIQGVTLTREEIREINRTPRRASREINLREMFSILSVDATAEGGFTVRVRSAVSGQVFNAALYDSLSSQQTRQTIQRAEWNKQNVVLHIVARDLGGRIVEARVLRALPVRAQPLSFAGPVRRA